MRSYVLAALASVVALSLLTPAGAAGADRYSLANGCYTIQGAAGGTVAGADKVRMQATTLGSYLLYTPDRKFLAAQANGSVAPAQEPSPSADWRVNETGGDGFTMTPASGGSTLPVRFVAAQGCVVYPEADLNATGTPRKYAPYEQVGGIAEEHMHWMTFEYIGGNFHCGRPWHPYGIQYALPDCSSVEGPGGAASPLQNTLNFGSPAPGHDTRGYPQFTEWGPGNLTYEGTYWRWVERAYLAGLRLMVMGVNENRELCELMANRKTNCNEMDTMRRGFNDIRELQRYVDAQAGGPGKGFFQIVTDPFQARRVINAGKMAVVLEIETSEPFDCRGWERSTCDKAQIDRQLEEMHRAGVRSSLLLNKFDNPLTGVRFDGGAFGAVINAGNRNSSGSFWSARTCTGKFRDNTIETGNPQGAALLDGAFSGLGVPSGAVPAYPPAPHCNTRGLTTLGRYVVNRMMDLKMIVNPDHMSQAAVDDTLTLLESRKYSGVISPHGWMDPGNWPRIWKLGGVASPGHSQASGYVKEYREFRPRSTPYLSAWATGADMGGLSHQPDAATDGSIKYPFKSYDGSVTFTRNKTGERTFDYNQEGVAHYGLYADWYEDLRRLGGEKMAKDLWDGAEAYLQMWERASGVRARDCEQSNGALFRYGLGRIHLGDTPEELLRRAGQPQQRDRTWSYCVKGKGNLHAADVAAFSSAGKVELVGSTARGHRVGGRAVNGKPRGLKSGITVRRAGRATRVWVVRKGRVRAVAVVTRSLSRRPKALRQAVARLLTAQATQGRPDFVPNAKQAGVRATGRTLAGSGDPKLDATFAMLCRLQVQ